MAADDRLKNYSQAMDIDPATDKPMPKVSAQAQYTSYVRKAADPFPVGKEGDSLYLWDTKVSYINDGTTWRQL